MLTATEQASLLNRWKADALYMSLHTAVTVTAVSATGSAATTITTGTAHGLATGNPVIVSGVGGATAVNGTWSSVTVVDTTHFTIPVVNSTTYTSGGLVAVPATATNEVTGGAPAYVRVAVAWGTVSGNTLTAPQLIINAPGATVIGAVGYWSALTAGNLLDSEEIGPYNFALQSTVLATPTTTVTG